jgi:hypothetical protein
LRTKYFNLSLLAIALICLIPRLMLGIVEHIEYDGYWHIWIAQQDNWANFLREYRANAHPPLYFLLQRLTFLFGRTNLTYRSISLIAGTASVYMLGKTARKAMQSPVWAALAALAYGLAMPSILMSNEVRTYMLSALLVQISFYYFLDRASAKSRIIFAVTATLACLTEYYALIFVGAVLLWSLIPNEKPWWRQLAREIGTFLLILVLPAWEFLSHFGAKTTAYDHLPDFYFQPGSGETAVAFLLRNLRNEVNCFSPQPIPEGTTFYLVLAAMIAVAIAIIVLARRNKTALAILILPLIMMTAIMFGAMVRSYPFGGFLRQQYVLFPFFAICPFLLLDRVPRKAGYVLAGIMALGVTAECVKAYEAYPKEPTLLLSDQMGRYNRMFPSAQSIYIDQFNLTTFFMHHHNWTWQYLAPLPGGATVDVYKFSRDGRTMIMFRDRDHWTLDLRDPTLFSNMATGMKTWHVDESTIFCLAQPVPKARTEAQVAAYRARVAENTAANGLCVQTLELDNYDVYAEFRTNGNCTVATE